MDYTIFVLHERFVPPFRVLKTEFMFPLIDYYGGGWLGDNGSQIVCLVFVHT